MSRPANFDRVAAIYQPGEYLTFGPLLERCRFSCLPAIARHLPSKALVLGDGDGRFLARLLAACPALHALAVDGSPAMLRRLRARASHAGAASRLTTLCADIRDFTPPDSGYNLVATHFFLDCLSPREADDLAARLRPHLAPEALWIVSEFQVPAGTRWRATAARAFISTLYAAFRLLTGLRVRRIPPWRGSLVRAGFVRCSSRPWLGGLLVSELWQATALDPLRSHPEVPVLDMEVPILDMPGSDRPVSAHGSVPGQIPGPMPGIDPGPESTPGIPPPPEPIPAPGPAPEPDPMPYPGPLPGPAPVT